MGGILTFHRNNSSQLASDLITTRRDVQKSECVVFPFPWQSLGDAEAAQRLQSFIRAALIPNKTILRDCTAQSHNEEIQPAEDEMLSSFLSLWWLLMSLAGRKAGNGGIWVQDFSISSSLCHLAEPQNWGYEQEQ